MPSSQGHTFPWAYRRGVLSCSSEIPSDLQDTQLSPEVIGPGSACEMLSPPISKPAFCTLEAKGCASCPSRVITASAAPSGQYRFQASPGHLAWLVLLQEQSHSEKVLRLRKREDRERSSGLWQAAPSHTLTQRLQVSKQVQSPGLAAAVERLFQILALASRKLLLISNLSVPTA